jgi:hypothetical protein
MGLLITGGQTGRFPSSVTAKPIWSHVCPRVPPEWSSLPVGREGNRRSLGLVQAVAGGPFKPLLA